MLALTDVQVDVAQSLSAVGLILTAYWTRQARRHARAADRAVNQRPASDPTIYELVAATGAQLDGMRRQLDQLLITEQQSAERLSRLDDRAQHLQSTVDQHLRWHLDHTDPPRA